MMSPSLVREYLDYDPHTGIFIWKVRVGRSVIGSRAGDVDGKGHRRIGIAGRRFGEHRLAWVWMTGSWPTSGVEVDHINGVGTDNRFGNLRLASRSQNEANTRGHTDSQVGLKGVSFDSRRGTYYARIFVEGQRIWLGRHDCPAAAHLAYIMAADKHFGEFART